MVSPTASTCNRYTAECTKTGPQILQVKRGQKTAKRTRKSPKKAKPGAFWVLEGMRTVVGRCERMGKPGNRAEGLGLRSAPVSSRQSATGARSPLGTRFWSGCGRAQPGAEKGSVSPGSRRKPQKGRCWFGAASYFWGAIVQATTTFSFERKAPPPEGWPS